MKILNDRVLGKIGNCIIRGRFVEYHTRDRGKFCRAELVFEDDRTIPYGPGPGNLGTGFSIQDLEAMHQLLNKFAQENYHSA